MVIGHKDAARMNILKIISFITEKTVANIQIIWLLMSDFLLNILKALSIEWF